MCDKPYIVSFKKKRRYYKFVSLKTGRGGNQNSFMKRDLFWDEFLTNFSCLKGGEREGKATYGIMEDMFHASKD